MIVMIKCLFENLNVPELNKIKWSGEVLSFEHKMCYGIA